VVAGLVRRSLAQVMGAVDYTYFKPSRRYNSSEGDGVIMPSLRQPEPKAVVVIDTSGSVSDAMQQRFLEETQGILRACGMKEGARVISVDAEVHTNQKVMNAKNIKLKGGGGTDMCVGIKAAMESKPKPDVVIVLTDGFTPWPQEPIGARLIIGIVGTQYGAAPATPPWAKMVDIDPDDTRASK
jgi:predicted metal-dependent peptidase